ncbi:hypothetical protein OHA79_09585 [Streptomyces sp. NBC_00841]|uniref:hypothetical protein n=1 Tax=Streptomyces sp. NBC_00841 TaxID=2975847 RepID=UPI002DD91048|nr:hypothetical protein [Streptomyces sp. NBC_00841]WRZ98066.1 hypothetical protein OHA79_09585 [Streptomyces sp. NBC_00841]
MDEDYDVVPVGDDPLQIPNTSEEVDADGNTVSTGYRPDTIESVSVAPEDVPSTEVHIPGESEGS